MTSLLRTLGWMTVLTASFIAIACGGGDHDELSNPSGGSAGSTGGPCASNAECSGSTPVCDELAGTCIQCLFDTQCGDGKTCNDKVCVASSSCTSSLDCVGGALSICDPSSSKCVECVAPADCTGTADCVANECVPYVGCDTSLECPPSQVCASALRRCVECESKTDCPEGDECVANACLTITECVSDNQCTSLGKLCDKTLGYCVDCLGDDQCPDAYHCAVGSCALDTCQAGASSCEGNAIVTCSSNGDQWSSPQPCSSETTCKMSGTSATCAPWVCDAGLTYCEGTQLVSCAADGLSVVSSVDCASSGKNCFSGACTDQACSPGTTYCEGKDVRQCNAQGSGFTVVDTCSAAEYCDTSTSTCLPMACSPGTPVCNGNVATTCNADGSGFLPGGTDCASQGKSCSGGSCAACPATPGAPSGVRLTEVYIGTDDYIVLQNRGNCAAELDNLTLQVISSSSGDNLEFNLPPFVLQPAEKVYVVDVNGAQTGDITSQQNIYLTPDTGEYVMLCLGGCSATTVLDYVSHGVVQPPPAAPYGISFVPGPLDGITNADQDTKAYVRSAFTGTFPGFKASDWQVGNAARPYQNPAGCPPTQPAASDPCTMMQQCIYGAVTCLCFSGWMCT